LRGVQIDDVLAKEHLLFVGERHSSSFIGVNMPKNVDVTKIFGKIKIVESFPDFKVKVVDSFPDLKVKIVDSFPNSEGKWKLVDAFPDFKIKIVDSFPDFKIKYVDSFPGATKR
jgi:hypothetical protein